jgi:uncharacterized protein (DUF1684 family)
VSITLAALFCVSYSAKIHTTIVQPKGQIACKIAKIANPQGLQYQRLKKFPENDERFEHPTLNAEYPASNFAHKKNRAEMRRERKKAR